ncbi:MAG: hypothetical protein BAJALOKI2v1_140059 [Promethearchaeota archaeon]|nr:MAG: hypothetical protein BAJALOKI2v1_140059 [Candidatus Lokiarchaeota archaeon]
MKSYITEKGMDLNLYVTIKDMINQKSKSGTKKYFIKEK